MTSTESASTTEETILSDEDVITLFESASGSGEEITVDQSVVDYSTPGEYQVVFTDESGNSTLTVEDVLPVIEVMTDQVTVALGDSIAGYITEFGAVATEITDGDLTANIWIDDSDVNYAVTGTYQVTFTVTDEEGLLATTGSKSMILYLITSLVIFIVLKFNLKKININIKIKETCYKKSSR